MAKNRKLRVILHIGPLGLEDDNRLYFTDREEDLYKYTRGEGQALGFVLENFDCSTEFAKALEDGTLLFDLKNSRIKVKILAQK